MSKHSKLLKSKNIRPPVKTHGGKWYLRNWIISHFPVEYEKMIFVECFAGGASVLLNKLPSRMEIINDIDRRMVNLFRVIRDDCDRLMSTLRQIDYDEKTFVKFQKLLEQSEGAEAFEEAVCEYAVRRMSRGGMRKAFAWSERTRGGKPGDQNAWETMIPHLPMISSRIQNVLFHNEDFDTVMSLYSDKNVLMYLDPPYLHETRNSTAVYANEMYTADHERLLHAALNSKSKIIISGYSSKMYENALGGWNRYDKDVANHSSQTSTKSRKNEILWSNF